MIAEPPFGLNAPFTQAVHAVLQVVANILLLLVDEIGQQDFVRDGGRRVGPVDGKKMHFRVAKRGELNTLSERGAIFWAAIICEGDFLYIAAVGDVREN